MDYSQFLLECTAMLKEVLKRCSKLVRVASFTMFCLFVVYFMWTAICNELINNFSDKSDIGLSQKDNNTSRQKQRISSGGMIFPPNKPFVILSISYHATPVYDLQNLLEPLGVQFIERGIMTYGCEHFSICRSTGNSLKDYLISRPLHWMLNSRWTKSFYNKYRDDPAWTAADAFLCYHPPSTCELFLLFGKPIIVLTTIRIDNGRLLASDRQQWLNAITDKLSTDKHSLIAANNRYDVAYTRFFTGAESLLLPSYCGYTGQTYRPTRSGFLLDRPIRHNSFTAFFMRHLLTASNESKNIELAPIHDLYTNYNWSDLAAHRGIVNLPVQPSMMAIFEQYRMNIPLFFPTHRLLVEWQLEHQVLAEINLYGSRAESFEPHSSQSSVLHPCSTDRASVEYWLQFCDWYSLPHIIYYDSFQHLASLLVTITDERLASVSRSMERFNRQFKDKLLDEWRNVLFRVAGSISNHFYFTDNANRSQIGSNAR